MIKIMQFADVIVVALWFTSDAFAHENKPSSNLGEFYFDDKSLNESTQHGNPLKTETIEFNKKNEHENIHKPHSEGADEYFAVRNLKRLIRYFVSLLHSINENNSHDAELLQDHEFGREPFSRNTKLKTNRNSSTPRIYKSSDTETIRDTEFENSGEGNDSEYYEEGSSFKNSYEEETGIETLKSNIKMKPRVRNHGRMSEGEQVNRDDNQKLTSEDFRLDRHRANHSAARTGQVSDEFIDEYINPATEEVLMESYGVPVTNQPIISNGRGNQTLVPLKESPRGENASKIADRKLINPQNSDSDNITIDKKTTLNKGVGKEEFPRNDGEKSDNTNHKTFSNQTGDIKNKNVKEITAVENAQNSFPSNKSALFVSNKRQNNKNSTSTSLSAEHTSNILNVNSSSPEEIELSHSQKPKISSVRKDAYDRSPKNFSVLDDSRNGQSLKENTLSPEPQMQSNNTSDKAEKMSSQQPPNGTKTSTMPRDFDKTNRLLPQHSSIDTESKNDTGVSNERDFVKHPKLEEKETREFSYASEGLKIRTDSNMDPGSSESSDSEADNWTQMQSESTSYKTEKGSSEQPLNSTKSFAMPGEFNKTNRLLPQNSSIDTESENCTDIPSEQHSVKYPKLEEKENGEFSNAPQELKVQADSDTDLDSSEYSNSEELYEYSEYDDVQLMSNFTNYFTETFSNATTQSSENFTAPFSNYSMEIELPTNSGNDSKINMLHKTEGLYNSIIEFLYKYSNSTWIKKLKEENRRM